jgi:hypothetical protein
LSTWASDIDAHTPSSRARNSSQAPAREEGANTSLLLLLLLLLVLLVLVVVVVNG